MYSEENLNLQLAEMQPPIKEQADAPSAPLQGMPLASVYAPTQAWQELYDEGEALWHGTQFRELEFPFLGGGGRV